MTGLANSPQLAAVAEVLCELGAEIEALGTALCQDPALAGRHMHELQAIDLIAQKQRSLASLFAAGLTDCAINAVGIETLRVRLTAALCEQTKTEQTVLQTT